jgi:2-polyprenyl-3-methyl-5-hydroxy-6-metoxy-1,4-benzoquinol methylase
MYTDSIIPSRELLVKAGFDHRDPKEFTSHAIRLRDGREARLWMHSTTGHGILDSAFWEDTEYYYQQYRKEFTAKMGQIVDPQAHLDLYCDLFDRQFVHLAPLITPSVRYLEIGCSAGGILGRVVAAGAKIIHGVEPNIDDAQHLSTRLPSTQIFNSSIEDADIKDNSYDVIGSFEVIEHLQNPKIALKKIARALATDGTLHIEVPNHNDAMLTLYGNDAYRNFYYRKAHIHYFTPASLTDLCRECGLVGAAKGFQIYPMFNHVHWCVNNCPQPSADIAFKMPVTGLGSAFESREINDFFKRIVKDYETLLASHMVSDSLVFQGKKIGV